MALALGGLWGCGSDVRSSTGTGGSGAQGGGGNGGTGADGGGGTGGVGGEGGIGGEGGGTECTPVDIGDPPAGPTSSAVDLLLVVDNSRGFADKQELLSLSVPTMISRFTNPRCLDAMGVPAASQPASGSDPCPAGSTREMTPVTDLHVGVISSSLGGHGSDACSGSVNASENDEAHLLSRTGTDVGDPSVVTYDDQGFLAWDPQAQLNPPGESDQTALEDDLEAMILGAGEVGCGFEAPLESWYRFLVEPDPHDTITIENNSAVLQGTDQTVLDQRAAFLRPSSTVVVVMLTDENDCSTRDGGQYYFANQIFSSGSTPYHLPKPRAACAVDPNDACCRSCGQNPGPGCDTSMDDCNNALSSLEDNINLRCFDQKRRFGIDFMWPVDRYVTGLTASQVTDRFGNLVANPLFANGRDPSQVYLTGIVGVPWQDIARRDANGAPDILAGLDEGDQPVGGLQSAKEREAACTWDVILGDPAAYVDPADPHMIESIEPRSGTNPITGDAIGPVGSPSGTSPINGHEYSIPQNDDLQYACIMPLLSPKDCSISNQGSCSCNDPANDSPLCQDPSTDQFGTTQYFAKANPGRRPLQVLRALEHQGIVGSICAPQVTNADSPDYAYNAMFDAIAATVKRSVP